MSEVSQEDFDAWRNLDITKAVFDEVHKLRADIVESWLNGVYAYDDDEGRMALGRALGYKELLEMKYIDV